MGRTSSGWPSTPGTPVAASSEYGVREFVNLMVQLLRFYGRHQAVLGVILPTDIAAALDLLASAEGAFEALNADGPA